ncbi:MAG: hypothetical protein WAU45_24435 [Blastocatellia bacterium]
MRIRSVILGLGLVVAAGLASEASAQAVAQPAHKPVAKNVKRVAKAPAASPIPAVSQTPPATPADQTMTMAKPKPRPKRRASQKMAGVPKGVPACIKHLAKMAEKDPLIDYDGHPSEIINGGLLWNDPKSRCSVAGDESMRKKVVDLAGAWRKKDGATVRSLLAELGSAAGSK